MLCPCALSVAWRGAPSVVGWQGQPTQSMLTWCCAWGAGEVEYELDVQLHAPVVPERSSWTVLSTKASPLPLAQANRRVACRRASAAAAGSAAGTSRGVGQLLLLWVDLYGPYLD